MGTSAESFPVDGEPNGAAGPTSRNSQAAAPRASAAAVFWHNWKVWPVILIAVILIWIFSWMYFAAAWGIEVRPEVATLNELVLFILTF